jgi:hypothetical protein
LLSFFNIVVEDYLALSSCDSGDDSDDGCGEYLERNYRDDNRDDDRDDVYVHGRKNRVGDPFAELLEHHSFLVSLIFSFRLIILYLMPIHD